MYIGNRMALCSIQLCQQFLSCNGVLCLWRVFSHCRKERKHVLCFVCFTLCVWCYSTHAVYGGNGSQLADWKPSTESKKGKREIPSAVIRAHSMLQATRDCLCLHPVSQFHPLTHHEPVSFKQEGGGSAIHSALGEKISFVVISFTKIKTKWFSCFGGQVFNHFLDILLLRIFL